MTKPSGRNSLIVTVPMAAVAAAWIFLVFTPVQKAIGRLQAEAAEMEEYCQRASRLLPALKQTGRELADARGRIAHWDKAVPLRKDLSELLGEISALARSSGLRTTQFDPDALVAHERVAEIPLTMGVTGPFPQLFRFLGKLEAMPQTIWLERLGIQKQAKDTEDVSCEISLAIFMDNPEDSGQASQTNNR